jgi:transcriptional regulator with XRE-family HTH domain
MQRPVDGCAPWTSLAGTLRFVQSDEPPQEPPISGPGADRQRLKRPSIEGYVPVLQDNLKRLPGEVRAAIREFREDMGISQTALAKDVTRIGISLDGTAITRIESGQRGIRVEELWAIAAVLQVELMALIPVDPVLWGADEELEYRQQRIDDLQVKVDYWAAELAKERRWLERLAAVPKEARRRQPYTRGDRRRRA